MVDCNSYKSKEEYPEYQHEKKEDPCAKIVCSEAQVTECQARLFCTVTERLSCEIKKAPCLQELEKVIKIADDFLLASAAKETAISEVIASCEKKPEKEMCKKWDGKQEDKKDDGPYPG